jgi:CheY-like chemotaxis protein
MLRFLLHCTLILALVLLALARAPAQNPKEAPKDEPRSQEYRQYFKQPTTVPEFWNALRFELDVGRPDLAARHLHGLLALKPTDPQLVELQETVGTAAFLKLRNVARWSEDPKINDQAKKDVDELISRVTAAVKRTQADEKRIRQFVKNLTATPEESDFALRELYKSGPAAIPYLIEELRSATGAERQAILKALVRLGPDTLPPLVAALDSNDANLKIDLIDVFVKRNATSVVPDLWYLAAGPNQPEGVRTQATQALSHFLGIPCSSLNPKVALTNEAERYYKHQVKFGDPRAVTVWRWDGRQVVPGWPGAPTVSASQAEEYFGLRYADQALAIDPSYQPAQQVLLSLALDKAMERVGPDKSLQKGAPRVNDLLGSVSGDLLVAALSRAMEEKRTPVVLGLVRALGERAEVRAVMPLERGTPPLVCALDYPDPRVQFAAAESILQIGKAVPKAASRVVEILSRALSAQTAGIAPRKFLVAVTSEEWRTRVNQTVRQMGAEPLPFSTGRAALLRMKEAADVDAVLLDSTLPDPGLAHLLGQLRADPDTRRVPILLAAVPTTHLSHDLVFRHAAIVRRLEQIDRSTQTYRAQRAALEKEQTDRVNNLMQYIRPERREEVEEEIQTTKRNFRDRFQLLADRNPEAVAFEKEAQQLRQELQQVQDRYDLEALQREDGLRRFVLRYPLIDVVPAGLLTDVKSLQASVQSRIEEAGVPLTEAERKDYAERAIRTLAGLARGEPPGFDVCPAGPAVLRALREGALSPEGQIAALEIVSRLSGAEAQTELANVLLDGKRPPIVRSSAALEFVRHVQRYTPLISRAHVDALTALYAQPNLDPALKANVAYVLGSLRPGTRLTGERLMQFPFPVPVPPAPPAPPKEK